MTLTSTAVEQLRDLLDDPEPKLIRVGVKNNGCSGSAYHLEYVDAPGKFDEQVEQDGVKVLIDSKALIKVIGSEMDWVEDKLSARFVFRNPNVSKCAHHISLPGMSVANMSLQLNNVVAASHLAYHETASDWTKKHRTGVLIDIETTPRTAIYNDTSITTLFIIRTRHSESRPLAQL